MSHVRATPPEPTTDHTGTATSADALEHDVERQREELAATVHALSHKLDVKTQAGLKAEHLADRATTASGKPRPELVVLVGGLLAGTVGLLWWRRHR